eukprot:gb/GECG01009007.1/.p1 GENE.gb/GECG01009007.1/~~gb/GECG01009007.1/.p1  ORF type:complete len:281 (+),score=22.15 gb/GECG01009007.1/:1-843(+)
MHINPIKTTREWRKAETKVFGLFLAAVMVVAATTGKTWMQVEEKPTSKIISQILSGGASRFGERTLKVVGGDTGGFPVGAGFESYSNAARPSKHNEATTRRDILFGARISSFLFSKAVERTLLTQCCKRPPCTWKQAGPIAVVVPHAVADTCSKLLSTLGAKSLQTIRGRSSVRQFGSVVLNGMKGKGSKWLCTVCDEAFNTVPRSTGRSLEVFYQVVAETSSKRLSVGGDNAFGIIGSSKMMGFVYQVNSRNWSLDCGSHRIVHTFCWYYYQYYSAERS